MFGRRVYVAFEDAFTDNICARLFPMNVPFFRSPDRAENFNTSPNTDDEFTKLSAPTGKRSGVTL